MEILSDTTFRGKITVNGDGIQFSKEYEGSTYTSNFCHVVYTNNSGFVNKSFYFNTLLTASSLNSLDLFVGDKESQTFGVLSVFGGAVIEEGGMLTIGGETIQKWSDLSQYIGSSNASPTGYKTDLIELPSPGAYCNRFKAATIGIATDYLGTKGLPKAQVFKKNESDGSYKKVDCDIILKESEGLTDVILEIVPDSMTICGDNTGSSFWLSLDYL